jgi:phage gp29-like protein
MSMPEGWEIAAPLDLGRVEPGRAFLTAITYEDQQIARAVLGQDLTSTGGSGSGSYALGKVSQGVSDDWIQSLRIDLAECVLTSQIARAICLYSLGPAAPVPTVKFPNLTDSELAARRDLIGQMVTGQVVAPSESWIRSFLGLPESEAAAHA